MSRKHFIALAAEFNKQLTAYQTSRALTQQQLDIAVNSLKDAAAAVARVAAESNPNFNSNRFWTACGF